MSDSEALSLWTVYYKPEDHPIGYIARRFEVQPHDAKTTTDVVYGDTLEELRRNLPQGLVCLARHPDDDPVIVEVWL